MELDFENYTPTKRRFCLFWVLQTDTFRLSIFDEIKPVTPRGIFSTVDSIYDQLGFLSPVNIGGKIILTKIVASSLNWDAISKRNRNLEINTSIFGKFANTTGLGTSFQ